MTKPKKGKPVTVYPESGLERLEVEREAKALGKQLGVTLALSDYYRWLHRQHMESK